MCPIPLPCRPVWRQGGCSCWSSIWLWSPVLSQVQAPASQAREVVQIHLTGSRLKQSCSLPMNKHSNKPDQFLKNTVEPHLKATWQLQPPSTPSSVSSEARWPMWAASCSFHTDTEQSCWEQQDYEAATGSELQWQQCRLRKFTALKSLLAETEPRTGGGGIAWAGGNQTCPDTSTCLTICLTSAVTQGEHCQCRKRSL